MMPENFWIFEEDQDAEMAAGIDPGENQKLREKIASSTEEMAEEFLQKHGIKPLWR